MQPQIPDNIPQLADKWIKGTITATERNVLLEWYAQQTPAEITWDSADAHENELEERLYAALQEKLSPRLQPVKSNTGKRLAQAAAILLLLTAGWAGLRYWQQSKVVIVSADGGIKKMILPDSSIVWLKGNSALSYHADFGKKERQVELKGEGLFEIKKDAAHPFIVESGQYTTRVLGTSFNIKEQTKNSDFSLLVLTGKVQVAKKNSTDNTAPLLITPDYQFFGNNQQSTVNKASNTQRAESVNGTEYDMNFNRTSFPDIIKRIEHKFDVKVSSDYSSFEACRITADITDQSLSNSLKLLTMAINAEYEIKEGTIIITGNGCK